MFAWGGGASLRRLGACPLDVTAVGACKASLNAFPDVIVFLFLAWAATVSSFYPSLIVQVTDNVLFVLHASVTRVSSGWYGRFRSWSFVGAWAR
jgi:hypothetical protein